MKQDTQNKYRPHSPSEIKTDVLYKNVDGDIFMIIEVDFFDPIMPFRCLFISGRLKGKRKWKRTYYNFKELGKKEEYPEYFI